MEGGEAVTPQEAVDWLARTGVTRNDRAELRRVFEKVAATAKKNETRRCANYVRNDRGLNWLADDLLVTGGLKVEV
jgi:hypothetical protein